MISVVHRVRLHGIMPRVAAEKDRLLRWGGGAGCRAGRLTPIPDGWNCLVPKPLPPPLLRRQRRRVCSVARAALAGERGIERRGDLDGVGVAQIHHANVAARARTVERGDELQRPGGWRCRHAPAGCCCWVRRRSVAVRARPAFPGHRSVARRAGGRVPGRGQLASRAGSCSTATSSGGVSIESITVASRRRFSARGR